MRLSGKVKRYKRGEYYLCEKEKFFNFVIQDLKIIT